MAILKRDGTIPDDNDLVKICFNGLTMDNDIFLSKLVEIPDISGVLLFSSLAMQPKISSSRIGWLEKSNLGNSESLGGVGIFWVSEGGGGGGTVG